jgi:hypothetical protein
MIGPPMEIKAKYVTLANFCGVKSLVIDSSYQNDFTEHTDLKDKHKWLLS